MRWAPCDGLGMAWRSWFCPAAMCVWSQVQALEAPLFVHWVILLTFLRLLLGMLLVPTVSHFALRSRLHAKARLPFLRLLCNRSLVSSLIFLLLFKIIVAFYCLLFKFIIVFKGRILGSSWWSWNSVHQAVLRLTDIYQLCTVLGLKAYISTFGLFLNFLTFFLLLTWGWFTLLGSLVVLPSWASWSTAYCLLPISFRGL